MRHVSYYGLGPLESYADKRRASWHGEFAADAEAFHEDYIRPQENGSRADCDYVALSGGGLTLTAVGQQPFSFNVSPYTQEELASRRHNTELRPCGSTVLCLDAAMAGIGSNSCGPSLARRYQVDARDLGAGNPLPAPHHQHTQRGEAMSGKDAEKTTGAAGRSAGESSGAQSGKAEERRYLKWYNKVGYGSGDVAGNVVYVLLSAFVMIYLTDTAGLNPGVVATLMMVSRLFDGFSDIIFGALLDRTNTRMGKARPWMLWGFVGCAAMLIAIFAIPTSLGDTAKYAWFFIAYTLLNAVFFTANNIAYSSLTALITRNGG